MLEFDEARARVLEAVRAERGLAYERVTLEGALGRVLAEDVLAPASVPSHDHSAMDGYAVRAADFSGAGPWELAVVGECQTGHAGAEFRPGACVRIFTGAHLPEGADAVVAQEDVERRGERFGVDAVARFIEAPRAGRHVRRAGEDLERGALALPRGTRLGPQQLGLLAAVDRAEVQVTRRPRVTVLCTGDELRPPGAPGAPGLPESNSVALAALARSVGAAVRVAPPTTDTREATELALRDALEDADLLLTVGGVSVGDHDVVRPALEALGVEAAFWKVNMRPGKPLLFGRRGASWVLGLPGNPASAQVTFALFGVPLLRALQGDQCPLPDWRSALLEVEFRQKPGRPGFYRGVLRGDRVELLANQASGAMTSMGRSNCLVRVAGDAELVLAGTRVEVLAYSEL
jgi:molybdopterin molybdotransferase